MWDIFWEWATSRHVYQTLITLFIIGFGLNTLLKTKMMRKFLGNYKKIKVGMGGVELEQRDGNSAEDVQQDSELSTIKDDLKEIKTQLMKLFKFNRETSIKAGNSVVWSDVGAPFVEVVRAGLSNASLGANGNLRDRMVEVIMGIGDNGMQIYYSLLNEFIENAGKEQVALSKEFYETIKYIEDRLV